MFDLETKRIAIINGKQIIKKVLFLGQDNRPRSTVLMGEPLRMGILW